MAKKTDTPAARSRLAVRAEPYWKKLLSDKYLGYRKRADGGTWIAQWHTKEKQKGAGRRRSVQKRLGPSQETEVKLDPRALTYDEAFKKAMEWFEQCAKGVVHPGSVSDACKKYVDNLRREKGEGSASHAEGYFENHVHGKPFGDTKLDELTAEEIRAWLSALVEPGRKRNSANRILRTLKAALNFAFREKMCPSDGEWRRVKPLKGEGARDEQRTAYLTPEQRRLLLAKADDDTATFIRALLFSAARPNELQAARVADFDANAATLRLIHRKGKGEENERHVLLSPAAVEFFKQLSKSKLPAAPLVTYESYPWARHQWAQGIRAAFKAANAEIAEPKDRLPPDVVAYTMRHCAITDMLQAGIGVFDVAKMAGTSVVMINSHYHKFIVTDVRKKLTAINAF